MQSLKLLVLIMYQKGKKIFCQQPFWYSRFSGITVSHHNLHNRKLKGYEIPTISKQNVVRHFKKKSYDKKTISILAYYSTVFYSQNKETINW
jgi:hypothetical protein